MPVRVLTFDGWHTSLDASPVSKVIIEQNDPVKNIWMNSTEKRDALDRDTLCELTEVLRTPFAPTTGGSREPRRGHRVDRLTANAPLSLTAIKALTERQLESTPALGMTPWLWVAPSSQNAWEGMLPRLEKRTARIQGKIEQHRPRTEPR
jgi:hypothetical protein